MEAGQPPGVEDRLAYLEREASFWRSKFEELDKWRDTLEQWMQNFGFHIRSSGPGAAAKLLQVTSPSNGWSPDSSDVSSRVSATHNMLEEKTKRRARRKKHDIDYKETEDPDEFGNNVPVKRKRGRPKKSQVMGINMLACPGGPTINSIINSSINSSSPDIKQESSELSWDAVGENAGSSSLPVSGIPSIPMKRGRGRPKKIKSENDEYAFDEGDREKRKPGRKKRELGMPMSKTCETCVLEFENNYDLLAHKRVVHPDKFHKCTICNDTYLHAGFLARHMETHTLDKEYKCHLCISSFNTYQLLKTHCLEKHGVDLGRQADWKRDNELAMTLKNHDYGHTDYSPQSMMSSPSQSCSTSGTPHTLQSQQHIQHHLQQQQQSQQQHQQCSQGGSIHQQGPQQMSGSVLGNHMNSGNNSALQTQLQASQMSMGNPNVNQLSSQISNAALQSQLQQQQQQQSQLQQEQHHHHQQQQQQQHLHHHSQQSRHHLPSLPSTDDDELDMDDDPLNSLFNDAAGNEGALGNYLNNMEPDSMQLY